MPLHLGLILPNYGDLLDAERLASAALAAESAGFDSGWVNEPLRDPSRRAGDRVPPSLVLNLDHESAGARGTSPALRGRSPT